MTKDEALKLALEALERGVKDGYWNKDTVDASTRIKEVLSQPKQEPVIGTKTWFEDGKMVTQHLTAKDIYKEPEPVIDKSAAIRIATSLGWEPKRTWSGLTDEEISAIDWKQNETLHDFARSIEAKLKEKNR